MKILSIDTAHGICSIALAVNGAITAEMSDNEPSRQAERLFLTIDKMLKEYKLSYRDIDAIAADIGPGSFTGVRIGLAAAQGIALAANIPVIGVSGLEALEYGARNITSLHRHGPEYPLLVTMDAKRSQVFAQYFHGNVISEPLLLNYEDIITIIDKNRQVTVTGNGAGLIAATLEQYNITYYIAGELQLPTAGMVALKAFTLINSGNYIPNPTPLYIRPPDAKLPNKN